MPITRLQSTNDGGIPNLAPVSQSFDRSNKFTHFIWLNAINACINSFIKNNIAHIQYDLSIMCWHCCARDTDLPYVLALPNTEITCYRQPEGMGGLGWGGADVGVVMVMSVSITPLVG